MKFVAILIITLISAGVHAQSDKAQTVMQQVGLHFPVDTEWKLSAKAEQALNRQIEFAHQHPRTNARFTLQVFEADKERRRCYLTVSQDTIDHQRAISANGTWKITSNSFQEYDGYGKKRNYQQDAILTSASGERLNLQCTVMGETAKAVTAKEEPAMTKQARAIANDQAATAR